MIAYEVEGGTGRSGKLTVHNSLGETITSDNLEELLACCLTPHIGQFRCFADLNDAASPILAKLPLDNIKELLKKNRTQFGQFTLIYFKDKVLVVFSGRSYASYYHLGQYFPDLEGLGVNEVQKKGEELVDALWGVDIKPSKLSSPVACIEDILKKLDLPTWRHIPDEVAEGFWEASGRAWTEAIKLGNFTKVQDIDCRAAYGSVLANLLDLRCGRWYHQKQIPKGAEYGWGYGRISVRGEISPITFVDKFGRIFNPKGQWSSFLMLPEVRFIQDYETGTFNPSDGHWWVPDKRVQRLHMLVWKLYRDREKSQLLNSTLKRAIAGIAGRMLQTFDDGFGDMFNPCWGGTVQSTIRCTKVGGFIYDNHLQSDLIAIATDGCMVTKEISVPQDSRMGAWRIDGSGPALVVDSNLVFFGSKRPNQLSYDEAMTLIQAHPLAKRWATKKQRRKTLGDVSAGKLASYEDLGKKMTFTVGFSIPEDDDRDREFPVSPIHGRALLSQVYESKALNVNRLVKPVEGAIKEERL